MTRLFLGAYWGGRKESLDECTGRLSPWLISLRACDESFAAWYEKDSSRVAAMQRPLDIESRMAVRELLDGGRHRNARDHAVIGELGFHIELWNGANELEQEAGVSATCGGWSPYVGNGATINLPRQLSELKNTNRMLEALKSTVLAWDPDWAGVMSKAAMRSRRCGD